MAMSLGSYTFALNPGRCTMPLERKQASVVETLGGGAYFSWGAFLPGQVIDISWEYMLTTQFDELATLFEADAQVVWDPENGSTYNVEIMSLLGDYHLSAAAAATYKKNVIMKLVIISEVA